MLATLISKACCQKEEEVAPINEMKLSRRMIKRFLLPFILILSLMINTNYKGSIVKA
jgi:hypothetical protein